MMFLYSFYWTFSNLSIKPVTDALNSTGSIFINYDIIIIICSSHCPCTLLHLAFYIFTLLQHNSGG